MHFPQAPAVARRILSRWRRSGWLWCCARSCWWCSQRMTKRSNPAGSGRGRRGASERRVQSRSTPSEAKPGSLWTCGPAPSPAVIPRVCHRPPDCTRASPHSSVYPGTLWCWRYSRLRRCEVALCGLPLHHLQRIVRCVVVPSSVEPSGFVFWGYWQSPVVISWIGRAHELYSGASPISLVVQCHFQTQ